MNGDVTVRDVMAREYVGVSEADGVLETIELLLDEDAGCAVVLRGRDPVGLLTQRDVLELLSGEGDPTTATVADAMTPDPDAVDASSTVTAAADALSAAETHRLLVRDGDEVVGVLTERDLLVATTTEPTSSPTAEAAVADPGEAAADGYASQSICEACGALTRDLADVDGQLLCPDCRNI